MGPFTIDPATVDPNVIYLAFVISLWIGVTAAYIPGTGVFEGVGLLGLVGSIVILSQMPTNWLAALMIVIGISMFMVMPFVKQQYAPLAVGGLVLQGIGALTLFDGITASYFLIAITLVIPLAYHQMILLPMLRRAAQQPVADKDDLLVGQIGRVTREINPVGAVHINSESWSARSEDEEQTIPAGTPVMVVERKGLQLIVEPVKRKVMPEVQEEEEEV